jgi:predicted ATPase
MVEAMTWRTEAALFRRELQLAWDRAAATLELAVEHGLSFWTATDRILQGAASAGLGRQAEGISQIQDGMAQLKDTGDKLFRPYHLELLAQAFGQAGEIDRGLAALDEAMKRSRSAGLPYWDAAFLRRKGELLLALNGPETAAADACFREAIEIAQGQQAKSLELRAATSLARLWADQGKRAQARDLLAPVYGWFTEGFDTPDLIDAKALLDELG